MVLNGSIMLYKLKIINKLFYLLNPMENNIILYIYIFHVYIFKNILYPFCAILHFKISYKCTKICSGAIEHDNKTKNTFINNVLAR